MSATTTVTVTGAAGNIGYALLFRIAAGDMLGSDTRIRLRLLEIPAAVGAAEGTAMELEDGAFPLLESIDVFDDPRQAFDGTELAMLVGSRPRSKGMERSDLLAANASIFATQGAALNDVAADSVRAVIVGNPANTNTLVASANAPSIPASRFTALTRLDHNRALAQLAKRTGVGTHEVKNLTIWGNHSATQYPDIFHATIGGRPGAELAADTEWLENDFIPTVAQRGTAIIEARGASSAASAASAVIDHTREWVLGSPADSWTSAAVISEGSYGIEPGVFASVPVRSVGGQWEVVEGLEINAFSRARIDASIAELVSERAAVTDLGFLDPVGDRA